MAVDIAGMQVMEHLNRIFQMPNHDFSNSSFTQTVSKLNRTGHARFRRGPSNSIPQKSSPATESRAFSESTQSTSKCTPQKSSPLAESETCSESTQSVTTISGNSSVTPSSAGEGSVSNGNQTSAPVFSARKPPLPTSHRKRHGSVSEHSVSHGCHCCKRRKIRVKRVTTSIPADEYSWKKYGEKTTEGSNYPRVYYKCISAKGCHARKRVEVARDGSKLLIVTYAGEHRHVQTPAPVPAYLTVPFRSKVEAGVDPHKLI